MWIHRTAGLRSNTCKFPSHAAPPKQKKARRAEIRAKSVQAGLSLQIAAFLLRPQGFLSVRAAKCLVHPPAAVVRSRKMLSLWLRQRLVQVAHFCFPPVSSVISSLPTPQVANCLPSVQAFLVIRAAKCYGTAIPETPWRGKRKRGVQKYGRTVCRQGLVCKLLFSSCAPRGSLVLEPLNVQCNHQVQWCVAVECFFCGSGKDWCRLHIFVFLLCRVYFVVEPQKLV